MTSVDLSHTDFRWTDMFRALWYFLKGQRHKAVLWQIVISIAFILEVFLPPYAIARLSELLVSLRNGGNWNIFFFYAIVLGLSLGLAGIARNRARLKLRIISLDMGYRARVEGFERLMNFSYAWHQEENSGVRVQRITTGVNDLIQLFINLYRQGINLVVSLVGTFAVFTLVNWTVGLFFAVYLALVLYIEWFYNHRTFEASNQENAAREKTSGTYYESASNALTVKALGVQEGIKKSVMRTEQLAKEKATKASTNRSEKYRLYQGLGGVGAAIFLSMLGVYVLKGSLAVPYFLAYYIYFNRMRSDTVDFGDFITDLADLRAGIGRMMPIYWAHLEHDGTESIPNNWKKIIFEKVTFAYPGSPNPALQDISMTIERGQKIGIAGRSGEGKSTLVKLLLSVYVPNSGSITFGGVPLQEIRSEERVHHISAVLQETELFSLSLRENITVFRDENVRRLEMAIRVAQLGDLLAELPEGLDTQVGEKGYKLSGGQRQRLGIARAIYGKSDLIVMDEATSSLDSVTEAAVQRGIEEELGNRTLVMIAHRLSTLRHADIIYFVAGGRIVEKGTFDELIIKENGLFRQQFELQNR